MKKTFVAICIAYSSLSFLYHFVLRGVTKFLMIPLIVFAISTLAFYINSVVLSDLKQESNRQKRLSKKNKEIESDNLNREIMRDYDTKVKPLYIEGKSLFNQLMKKKMIRNYEISDIKKIIDNRLGVYSQHYHNYKFKNDAHEIYVKMKNFKLNEYDWGLILDYLHSIEGKQQI